MSAWSITSATSSSVSDCSRSSRLRESSGRDDREERVLRGGGDEGDPAVLHAGQQRVLLGLGEAVHLVDEEHRLLAAADELGARPVDGGADLLDARRDRRHLDEAAAGLLADDRGDRRLAGARAAPRAAATSTGRPRSAAAAASPAARSCCWPTSSSIVRGRIRTASGAEACVLAPSDPPRDAPGMAPGAGCPAPGISNKPSTSVSIPRRVATAEVRPPWSAWS